jgi:hypothetical protein
LYAQTPNNNNKNQNPLQKQQQKQQRQQKQQKQQQQQLGHKKMVNIPSATSNLRSRSAIFSS